ncbi:MAG: DUF998 domain-containing protein [Actinomycetes bacterium]
MRPPWALTGPQGRWLSPPPGGRTMAANRALGRAPHKLASGLLLTAGATILLGIITAEALYTAPYTTRMEISDLGATDTGVILHPSSYIFNATMLITGAMILIGAWFTHRALHRRAVTIPTGLLGIGVLGVGIFPGNIHPWHPIFAYTAFLAGGLAVLLSYKVTPPAVACHLRHPGCALAGIHRGRGVPARVGAVRAAGAWRGGAVDGLPRRAMAGRLRRLPERQPAAGAAVGVASGHGGRSPHRPPGGCPQLPVAGRTGGGGASMHHPGWSTMKRSPSNVKPAGRTHLQTLRPVAVSGVGALVGLAPTLVGLLWRWSPGGGSR